MATTRGFVTRIEIGRAGLVQVNLLQTDGSRRDFVIHDLDADPERFNERLSKLGILRDAMTRAEPVFIEHRATDQGEEIERVARISRDELTPTGGVSSVAGLVLDVIVHARNQATGDFEEADRADVAILTSGLGTGQFQLNLQTAEREVAQAQLAMLLRAESEGRAVRLLVSGTGGGTVRSGNIVSVAVDSDSSLFGDATQEYDGFVESLSLLRLPASAASLSGTMAQVGFTTAPQFSGPGNTVGLVPFTPQLITLLVSRNSLTYQLFEAGLRDNLRMRVSAVPADTRPPRDDTGTPPPRDNNDRPAGTPPATGGDRPAVSFVRSRASAPPTDAKHAFALALGAELLAPLASASRGVWIKISRDSLDKGAEAIECVDGVPSSDLQPQTLRDLRLPYPAQWRGLGCFNHGVYRFQFRLPVPFVVCVDGAELCLHDADDGDAHFAHACLGGEHEITVKLDGWRCDYEFHMDLYRLR